MSTTVTSEQVAALVARLDGMRGDLSAAESEALDALVALAGDGMAAHADVTGFGGIVPERPTEAFSLNFTRPTQSQGILIGLLRNGTAGFQDFHFTGGTGGFTGGV
jgi:hypothetical protein